MKKFTALRGLRNQGIEVDDLFDPSEPDPEVADKKRALLNKMSVEDVISHYRQKVLSVAVNFSYKSGRESLKAGGQDLLDQVESWKETPSFGLSYASNYLTTVAMGMRPRRFNISSAGTGVGKSRLSIANICHTFAPKYYDLNTNTWVNNPNGSQNAALYIGTEMELVSEIEPIMLAYMSGVPEPHILMGQYEAGEEERVKEAIKILTEEGKIWLEYVPDYDAATLENIIEEHVDLHGVKHVFFDYIHTTTQLISEYQQAASARIQIREDQVLGDLSRRLKDMTRKFDVCIESWTQVSGDFKNEANRDQTIIRGSKAVADKIDLGSITSEPTQKEYKLIENYLKHSFNQKIPNRVISVYKNRGGRYNRVKIWLYVDYNTMRVHDLFVTDYNYKLIDIPQTYTEIIEDQKVRITTDKADVISAYKAADVSDIVDDSYDEYYENPYESDNEESVLKNGRALAEMLAKVEAEKEANLTQDDDELEATAPVKAPEINPVKDEFGAPNRQSSKVGAKFSVVEDDITGETEIVTNNDWDEEEPLPKSKKNVIVNNNMGIDDLLGVLDAIETN